jgi:hypothetical protein
MSASPSTLRLLVYAARYTGERLAEDLRDITERSTRNNARDGITGILLVDRGTFVQALEGPPEAIDRLIHRIEADPRAGTLEVLIDTTARDRSLWDWTLRTARVDTDPEIDSATLHRFRDAYLGGFRPDASGFIELLQGMMRR